MIVINVGGMYKITRFALELSSDDKRIAVGPRQGSFRGSTIRSLSEIIII